MKTRSLYIFFIYFFVLNALQLSAQRFIANANKTTVYDDEVFSITWECDRPDASQFTAPALADFIPMSGIMESQSMRIINGQVSGVKSFSIQLKPRKPGVYVIGAGSVRVGGQRLTSNTITIEARTGGSYHAAPAQPSMPPSAIPTPAPAQATSKEDVRLIAFTEKNEVYVGEALPLTYKILTKKKVNNPTQLAPPSFPGFWTEDTPQPSVIQGKFEQHDGIRYEVFDLRKMILHPQVTGDKQLEPLQTQVQIQETEQRPRTIIDLLLGRRNSSVTYSRALTLVAEPKTIRVLPLPEAGKPKGFQGAVGRFNIATELSASEGKTGEPISLKLIFSGTGNLKMLEAPILKVPQNIKANAPVTEDIQDSSGRKRTFIYTLIPQKEGDYVLPPSTFYYFDPETKRYDSLNTGSFNLKALKNADFDASQDASVLGNGDKSYTSYLLSLGLALLLGGIGYFGYKYAKKDMQKLSQQKDTKGEIPLVFTGKSKDKKIISSVSEPLKPSKKLDTQAEKIKAPILVASSEVLTAVDTPLPHHPDFAKQLSLWLGYQAAKSTGATKPLSRTELIKLYGEDSEKGQKINFLLDACEQARFAQQALQDPAGMWMMAQSVFNN